MAHQHIDACQQVEVFMDCNSSAVDVQGSAEHRLGYTAKEKQAPQNTQEPRQLLL